MPQVISIKTFYTSKRTSFFTFFLFLNVLPDSTRRIYATNYATPVPISVSELSNPSSKQNLKLLIKTSSV